MILWRLGKLFSFDVYKHYRIQLVCNEWLFCIVVHFTCRSIFLFNISPLTFQIIFEVVQSGSDLSDIAVDDIMITVDYCPPSRKFIVINVIWGDLLEYTLLKSDVTRRDHVSVVMDAGSRIVNLIRDGTVFA